MRVASLARASGAAPVVPVVPVVPVAVVASGGTRLGAGLHLLPTARTRAPLRFALARIAARLIATRAWERLGFARLADYARERTGLSARQLQDLAHTSVRLEALPAIEAALAAGRLGWSQARLVARVAKPEDEQRWITLARSVRVRELEHAVRAVDRGSLEGDGLETDEDGGDAARKVGVVVRCTPRVRAKFHAARALARRVAGEALPIWACMEAVTAEVLCALPVGAATEGDETDCVSAGEGGASWAERGTEWAGRAMQGPAEQPEETCGDEPAPVAANVCATQGAAGVDPLLVGLETADAFELDARLRRAVAQEQRLDAELAPFLAEVARSRAHLRYGFTSLELLARERLGLSPRKVRALLRIERVAAGCPALRAAFRSGHVSWVQVHAILPVLLMDGSTHSRVQWIEHAAQVSVRRLEGDVDRALSGGQLDLQSDQQSDLRPDIRSDLKPDRQACARSRALDATQSEPEAEPETARFFFNAPPDVARLFRAVVCSVRRHVERATGHLPSEGDAVEWMFEHAFEAWGANDRRVRREHRVFERDGWRCTVPGCASYRNLHDHHIVFRAAGGSDDLANRTTLCAWHHLRGVHAARVGCHGTAPGALVFELGLRPGREPLLRYAPGERLTIAAIVSGHSRLQ